MAAGAAPAIVVWGELVWDLYADGPRLGGCAANVACHAARLGNHVLLVSRVGDDAPGRAALSALAALGVDVSLVAIDGDAPTASVRVTVQGGEPRYEIVAEAAWDRFEHTPAVAAALRDAAVVCYAAMAQRAPLAGGALARALAQAPTSCARLCDLNLRSSTLARAAVEAALSGADAVKLNLAEAARLEATVGAADAVRFLIEQRGVKVVALTRGEAGCVLATATERVELPGRPAAPGGDAVGAGDAFTAVLAHHLARRSPLAVTAAAANAYALHVASARGAMPAVPLELLAACR